MGIKKIRNTKYEILNMIVADHSGITLLELTVSVALFALTIVMAAGIFDSVVASQRVSVAAQDLQDNIRYSFERMDKEIRSAQRDADHSKCNFPTGITYYSPDPSHLEFLNYHGQCVDYYLKNGQLYVAYPKSGDTDLQKGLPLTAKEVSISKLVFKVTDSAPQVQAFVTVRMHLSVTVKGTSAEDMDMETTLSSRSYQ